MTEHNSTPPAPAPATDDWTARCAMHEQRLVDARPINRTAVLAALTGAGITHVVVSFDGDGDSSQIETIEAKTGETIVELPATEFEWIAPVWDKDEPDRSRIPLCHAVEAIVYGCLEQTHMGWENDDGAYGDIIFDVAERTITLDYNERYTESEYSQHVF